MKTEIKQAWAEALRSGEFKQTTGILQDYEGYCCLGVLCALAQRAGEAVPLNDLGVIRGGNLPPTVRDWAGTLMPDPLLRYGTTLSGCHTSQEKATTLNDALKLTFAQIADAL